jgi:hypothetical protein
MIEQTRVILLCVQEDTDTWYPWYAMSEATWEAGGNDWESTPDGQATREVWVNISTDAINKACNTPDVEGTVECDG